MTNPIEDMFNNTINKFYDDVHRQSEIEVEMERKYVGNENINAISNKRSKAYMAGKLFSEADQRQREREYRILEMAHIEYDIDRDIFSPIYSLINDKTNLPSSLDVFNADEKELMESDVIFADLADGDIGVAMELGMVLKENVNVYAYLPDIRAESAGMYEGIHVPYGHNQFLIGGLEKYFGKVYHNFNEALVAYVKDHMPK